MRKRIGSALAALAALVAKFWAIVKAALIALPKLKLVGTAGTALVSIAAYALFFGPAFAIGLVALLFVHEMGHVIQLRREGLRASAPMFVPFLGAFIAAKSLGENALAEARVGIAGPILGTLGAALVAIAGALLQPSYAGDLLLALAYFGFFLNLLNLIPVVPFDGGRVMSAVAPGMWFLGVAGLVALVVLFHNPFLLVFIVLALLELPRRWRALRSRSLVTAAYYRVPRRSRIALGLLYGALIVALVIGMDTTHILRSGAHTLGSL
jgi:Zn-dependent protease